MEGGFMEVSQAQDLRDEAGRLTPHVVQRSQLAVGGAEGMRIKVLFPGLEAHPNP
jgi:hypothetical protein